LREPDKSRPTFFSHDTVEAALMRKAGFDVWFATEEGSCEEGPPNQSDSLARDRRWCLGNLQHFWFLSDSLRWLHREFWSRPAVRLHPWWKQRLAEVTEKIGLAS
jgi:membrane glycosyltransferase